MYLKRTIVFFAFILLSTAPAFAYSVLTHEEVVDLLWTSNIRPLIEKRFPGLTDDQIKEAHAYAYGGSVIQDLGYYPFGSKEFSDLVHYVRSGDFVEEMIRQSQDPKEFAFALGALAHYVSDVDGHPAVNEAVAMRYPKLRARYGSSVKYAQDKSAHLKTEFGFDTLQVAKNRYAPAQYHDFIGFEVSEPLLERVFPIVYGMDLKEVLPHQELAIGSYRWAIGRLIPQMTTVALQLHKKQLTSESPTFDKRKFLYRLSRADYEKAWGTTYQRPGFGTRFLTAILRIMPKIGPFKGLNFDDPTQKTEDLYIKSINKTFDDYKGHLQTVQGARSGLAQSRSRHRRNDPACRIHASRRHLRKAGDPVGGKEVRPGELRPPRQHSRLLFRSLRRGEYQKGRRRMAEGAGRAGSAQVRAAGCRECRSRSTGSIIQAGMPSSNLTPGPGSESLNVAAWDSRRTRIPSIAFPNSKAWTSPHSATGIRVDARACTPVRDGALRGKSCSKAFPRQPARAEPNCL